MGRAPPPAPQSRAWRPSGVFVLVMLIFIGSGAALFSGITHPVLPFVFILSGWVVSVCLHEFAHAIVAYVGGDKSVASSGYLTLDPLKYAHPLLSVVIPAVFIALGGFALPGGAVLINTRRAARTSMRFAGLCRGPGHDSAHRCSVRPRLYGRHERVRRRADVLCRHRLPLLPAGHLRRPQSVADPGPRWFRYSAAVAAALRAPLANRMAASGLAFIVIAALVMIPGASTQIVRWGLKARNGSACRARRSGPAGACSSSGRRATSRSISPVRPASRSSSLAVMKLGMLMNEPGIDRRKALIGGADRRGSYHRRRVGL